MANPWFKFYGPEYLSDTKMLGMDGNTRSCWLTLLAYASAGEGEVRYLSEEQLMIQAGVPMGGDEWQKTVGVLKRFEERGMVIVSDTVITIPNWQKRQEANLSGYERVKRHREKAKDDNADDNAMITLDKNREEKNRTDTMFDQLWKEYPKKVGKETARTAFKKLTPDEALTAKISAAIVRFKKTDQWKDNEGRYIPHFSTFLNQQRFEDEVFESKGPVPVRYERTEKGMRPIYEDYRNLPTSDLAKELGESKRV